MKKEKILEGLEASKKRVGDLRDKLRKETDKMMGLMSKYHDIVDACDEAQNELDYAVDNINEAIDDISQHL